MENPKKLYYELSDGFDVSGVVMELSGCLAWIEADMENYSADKEGDELPEYTITPIFMTEDEFNNLQEADI